MIRNLHLSVLGKFSVVVAIVLAYVIGLVTLPTVFAASKTASPTYIYTAPSSSNQFTKVGNALSTPLVVSVTDASNNFLSGISVVFSVTNGAGVTFPNNATIYTATTDVSGYVTVTATANTTNGIYNVYVQALGGSNPTSYFYNETNYLYDTNINLVVPSSSLIYGQYYVFTATISSSGGTPNVSGTLNGHFSPVMNSLPLTSPFVNGKAIFQIDATYVGADNFFVNFAGDSTYGPSKSNTITEQVQRIIASNEILPIDANINSADRFGSAVSASNDGETLLVGIYDFDNGPSYNYYRNKAYVLTKVNGNWQQQIITPTDNYAIGFGNSVSLSGDGKTVLVGAPYSYNSNGSSTNEDVGAAYIFTYNGTNWVKQTKLMASDGGTNDQFGYAVSLSSDGKTALVTSPYNSVSGAAYIFTYNGSNWVQQAKLVASDAAQFNFFGDSASLSGDGKTALVGASAKSAAYIFTFNGNNWGQQSEITDPNTTNYGNHLFGQAVSLSADGKTALISSPSNDAGGIGYIFRYDGSTWTQQAALTGSDTIVDDFFGAVVGLSGDGNKVIIGAPKKDAGYGRVFAGASYIFSYNGVNWQQNQKLTALYPAQNDAFGTAVNFSGDGSTAFVGVPGTVNNNGMTLTGSVYAFGNSIALTSNPNPSSLNQSITFTATVSSYITPSGNVTFLDNATTLATVPLIGNTATYTISSLGNGQHPITAVYSSTNSLPTITSAILTQTVLGFPSVPTNLTVTLSSNQNIISWQPPTLDGGSSIIGYNVYRLNGTTSVKLNSSPLTTTNFVDSNITINANYVYQVTAINAVGEGPAATVATPPNGNTTYTYYLPYVANNANNFTTYLAFQNIGTATANITVTYYDNNGNALTSSTLITQVALYGEALPSNPFASGTQGAGIITSDQPLNVIVPEATPYGGSAYAVSSGSSNSLIAPFALNNAFGDFTTQLNVFNGGASAVTATVTFYGTVGNSTVITSSSTNLNIAAHTTANLNQNTLPSGFSGWAQITGSANTLVAQVLEQSPNTHFVAIANAATNPSTTLYAPAVFDGGYGGFYTGANIINPNAYPVTVTLTYYDLTGKVIPASAFTIAAHGIASVFNGSSSGDGIPSGGLPTNFVGAVAVNAVGGGVVMSVNENGGLTGAGNSRSGTYAAVASGGTTVGLPVVSNGGYTYITGDTVFNSSSQPITATFTFYNTDGRVVAWISKVITIAPHASSANYQGDGSLPPNFYGTVVISQTDGPANALIVTTNAQNIALFYTYSEPNSQ